MHGSDPAAIEQSAREALHGNARPREWPLPLRERYRDELAPREYQETVYLTKIGIAVLLVSTVIEWFVMPEHFAALLLARLVLVLPLQIASLACPPNYPRVQKLLMTMSLLIFGAIMLRASLWASWPVNAYMASGPVSLFGVALPLLPLSRIGQRLLAVSAFAVLAGMALWFGESLPGREIYLGVAGLTGTFALMIAGRYRLLAERNFLLGVIAEERLSSLTESNRLLDELSRLDPLTGLSNRRHVLDSFALDYAHPPVPGGARVAVLLLDVDHFKAFNDRWGHQLGDDCLVAVAELMRHCATRHGGLAARFGGEEFVTLLQVQLPDQALAIAEELRRAIEGIELRCPEGTAACARCSVSIGVAVHDSTEAPQLAALMARADDALYRAKEAGRNRTVIDA